ncbi:thioesterase family protein [Microbulbifer sp. DLAB2-AF]|uniref:thioesterase family protein n=1 Tax=Microbulbifer sp. DLAB2-AF TaxID=3243395 RepID=UPI00403A0E3E
MELESREELIYVVQSKDLAKNLSIDEQDDFPEVFATSRMVALMELAAARLMKSLLGDDELSVGVNVTVNHLAATPNGEEVKAIAIYKGMEGKLYKFEVELHDKGGKAGNGTHTRAIVKTERLVQGAINRAKT